MPYDWRVGLSACQGLACCLLTLPTPSAACGNRRAQSSSACRGRVRLRAQGWPASAWQLCLRDQRLRLFLAEELAVSHDARRLRLQHSAAVWMAQRSALVGAARLNDLMQGDAAASSVAGASPSGHSALADGSTPRCDCWDDMIRMLLQQYFRGLEKLGLALFVPTLCERALSLAC